TVLTRMVNCEALGSLVSRVPTRYLNFSMHRAEFNRKNRGGYCLVLSLKSNSRPSEKMTFVPGSPDPIYATGAPFLAGHRMMVTSSPGLTESLVQPALVRIPGLFVSMPQCTMLPFLSFTSR